MGQKFELSLLQEVIAQWPNRMQDWLPPDWSLERDASDEQALVMVWGPSLKPLPPCTHAGGTGSTRSAPVFADSSGKYRSWPKTFPCRLRQIHLDIVVLLLTCICASYEGVPPRWIPALAGGRLLQYRIRSTRKTLARCTTALDPRPCGVKVVVAYFPLVRQARVKNKEDDEVEEGE